MEETEGGRLGGWGGTKRKQLLNLKEEGAQRPTESRGPERGDRGHLESPEGASPGAPQGPEGPGQTSRQREQTGGGGGGNSW